MIDDRPVDLRMPLARLSGVTCSYGGAPVLRGVDLEIAASQFTGVVGPSGSGKTTLLKLLLGSVRPGAGTVERRDGLRVGYVPQVEQVDWSFPITVSECVLMARTPSLRRGRRLPWPSRGERAEVHEVLSRLGIEGLGGRHIRELSGGQQQRVFIARALLGRPDLLLLDEPTTGLDVAAREQLLETVDSMGDAHPEMASILVTHHLEELPTSTTHALLIANGRTVASGAAVDTVTTANVTAAFDHPIDVSYTDGRWGARTKATRIEV